ncbi:MAG TPA: hypothetical protein VGP43_09930 [Chitinophagaceae bacterium]|nr:hypothetical protein [Chitinophagaceae bacterium]
MRTKQKSIFFLQIILSVFTGNMILTYVEQKPLKYILASFVLAYMGAVIGYHFRKRQESGDKLNYRYVIVVALVVAIITILFYKLTVNR